LHGFTKSGKIVEKEDPAFSEDAGGQLFQQKKITESDRVFFVQMRAKVCAAAPMNFC